MARIGMFGRRYFFTHLKVSLIVRHRPHDICLASSRTFSFSTNMSIASCARRVSRAVGSMATSSPLIHNWISARSAILQIGGVPKADASMLSQRFRIRMESCSACRSSFPGKRLCVSAYRLRPYIRNQSASI